MCLCVVCDSLVWSLNGIWIVCVVYGWCGSAVRVVFRFACNKSVCYIFLMEVCYVPLCVVYVSCVCFLCGMGVCSQYMFEECGEFAVYIYGICLILM